MTEKKKDEAASPKMAKLASKVLNTGKATAKEALSLAGAVLTNAPDKKPAPKPAPKPAAKPAAKSAPKSPPKKGR